jgi:hypothetical protein
MDSQEPTQIQIIQITVSKKQQEKPLSTQILQIGNQIANLLYAKIPRTMFRKEAKNQLGIRRV